MNLYACIHARAFPAQALLRLRPELRAQPCAILQGEPPLQSVCACNTKARRMGVEHGMTRVEVDTFPGVTVLQRSPAAESSARAALLDCAAVFSPAAEDRSSPAELVAILDITGTTRLHGPPAILAHALGERVRAAGISASIAVAANFHAANLPINVLPLTPDQSQTLTAWGIHTLGMLAALPETALIARMGQAGRSLRQLARGTLPHHFTPLAPEPTYTETLEFDAPIEQLESVLFIVGTMLDQLILRIGGRALAIATATLTLTLEGGGQHIRSVRPALPVNDKHLWLKLIHLDLDAHPPGAPVLTLTLTAEPGRTSKIQMGLFSPQLPDATRLDVALARVRAIVGEDSVGTPILTDAHRPDTFQVKPFAIPNPIPTASASSRVPHPSSAWVGVSPQNSRSASSAPTHSPQDTPLTQRQVRPAEDISVTTSGHTPASLYFRQKKYEVDRAYGPWLTGGDWWNQTLWGMQQWDIVARSAEGTLLCCCLVRDLMHNRWQIVALYD
jgi:protein ImuB